MDRLYFYLIISCLVFPCLLACSEDEFRHKPIENDNTRPGIVSNVKVTNYAGSALIQYSLPEDTDLQYVVARYAVNEETELEAKASYHDNQLKLKGFGRAGDYPVQLYAVDRSGNESEPVNVTVSPDIPPYLKAFESLDLIRTFGGVNVSYQNEAMGNIGIVVVTENNNGELLPVDALYTGLREGSFSVRGFDTVSRVFGCYVQDRWNNRSDTIIKTLKPLYERELDKSKFAEYRLPDDAPNTFTPSQRPDRAWDGSVNGLHWNATSTAGLESVQVTMDLGVIAELNRLVYWQRMGDAYLYQRFSLRTFSIWGRATPTNEPGYDGWTKLVDCEVLKPSGLPLAQLNADDRDAAAAGHSFELPPNIPPVRYIRIQVHENWSGGNGLQIGELSFFGDY